MYIFYSLLTSHQSNLLSINKKNPLIPLLSLNCSNYCLNVVPKPFLHVFTDLQCWWVKKINFVQICILFQSYPSLSTMCVIVERNFCVIIKNSYKSMTKDLSGSYSLLAISHHRFDLFKFKFSKKKKSFKPKCQTQSACSLTSALAAHILSVSVIPPESSWAASKMPQDTNSPKQETQTHNDK